MREPYFSIIMQSYLGAYRNAAKDREKKLLRAIDSCLAQSFDNWDLVIVADGCQKTVQMVQDHYTDRRIKLFYIEKQPLWSGIPRNVGKFKAKGDYICYLDIDDYFGTDHLKGIFEGFDPVNQWVWFNDLRWSAAKGKWYENHCHIDKQGWHGTSNICFKRSINVGWPVSGNYLHDFYFIRDLRRVMPYAQITAGAYHVCHIPNGMNFRGYDV